MKTILAVLFVLALAACATAAPTENQRQQLHPRIDKVLDNVVLANVKILNKNLHRATAAPIENQRQQLHPRIDKVLDNVVLANAKVLNKNLHRRGDLLNVKAR
ncbi:hypothetical protein IWQ61_003693 [Dispira simplex]|nr:hypothetical protein IWQ61_003693 [Dispira simplex]